MVSKLTTIFFLLTALLATVQGKQILGANSCTWGPSYWCKSPKTAAECDAFQHCTEHVWSKNTDSNGLFCGVCEGIVENLVKYINSSKAEGEIHKILDGLCTAMGGDAEKGCKTFANKYLPPFIQYGLKMIKPKQICALAKFCTASDAKDQIDLEKILGPGAVKNILTSGNIASILAPGIVRNVPETGNIESILAPGAERNVKKPISIESILAPGAVRNVKKPVSLENILAPGAVKNVKLPVKTQASSADSLGCIACSVIVSEIDSALGNKNTENKIVGFADKVCQILPAQIGKECQSYINQFGPPILQALLQYLPANQVCAYYIHACPKSVLSNEVRVAAPTQLVSGFCVFCEAGVSYIEGLLKINKTETEIYDAVRNLCNALPAGILRTECDDFVDKYAKAAIKLINSNIAPSSVCKLLGICNSSAMAVKKLNVCRLGPKFWCGTKTAAVYCKKQSECQKKKTSIKPINEASNELCPFCKTAVRYIESLIKINTTENDIYNDLITLCYIFPSGTLRTQCVNFVDKYTKAAFQLVNSDLNPAQACQLIGLCTKTQVDVQEMNWCLLGTKFWCRNKAAAAQCKRRVYCGL